MESHELKGFLQRKRRQIYITKNFLNLRSGRFKVTSGIFQDIELESTEFQMPEFLELNDSGLTGAKASIV